MNTACSAAYRIALNRGFQAQMVGVVMERPGTDGYHRPDTYVIDDWR